MGKKVYDDRDIAYIKRVLDEPQDITGAKVVAEFEERFAEKVGSRYAVAVANGMCGLHTLLAAAGVGPAVEVIVDPIVQFGALSVLYNNGVPIFADVDPATHNMDPRSFEERLTPDTKAAVVTHLWGLPAEVEQMRAVADRQGIVLVEDCAHALLAQHKGRRVGTWGHAAMFSFQASKHLSTGDGGMLTTSDEGLLQEIRSLMNWGAAPDRMAYNFRMPGVVAAVGLAQLERADDYVRQDMQSAELYHQALEGCEWLVPQVVAPYNTHSQHIFAVAFRGEEHGIDYEEFKRVSREEKAGLGFGYTQRTWREAQIVAAYQFPVFKEPVAYGKGCPTHCPHYRKDLPYRNGYCPNAEDLVPRLCLRGLSSALPDDIARGAEGLRRAIERVS
ncbi:MAG: DegT/DnrJ/EryC1/StrS family aminotransferase [Anaerolineae bacterium]|nr:DegT/DnrJ/EryC1/StrS family aminotransferase [Anaerolineae bacterium]